MLKKSDRTKAQIVDAALETLKEDGYPGASARAIAQRGGFNQALIFYHFGSVPNLLMEAFRSTSAAQVERYRAAAADVTSLSDLVEIARRLHADDEETRNVTAVTQLMAAAASDPQLGKAMLDCFEDWIALVEDALRRATAAHPLASLVPTKEAAYAIASMFLGIELLTRLDPPRSNAEPVFDMMAAVARLIEQLGGLTPGT